MCDNIHHVWPQEHANCQEFTYINPWFFRLTRTRRHFQHIAHQREKDSKYLHFCFIKTWFQSPKLCLSSFSVLVKRFNTFSCILTLIILQSAIIFVDNRKSNLTNSKSSYWFFFLKISPFSCLEYDILENNTALVLTSLSWVCKTGNIFTLYVS